MHQLGMISLGSHPFPQGCSILVPRKSKSSAMASNKVLEEGTSTPDAQAVRERNQRRHRWRSALCLGLVSLLYLSLSTDWLSEPRWSFFGCIGGRTIQSRVHRILKTHPIVDTHVDLPELARWRYQNMINGPGFKFDERGFFGHVDIPRMKEGRLGGVFWSVYTSCPTDWNDTNAIGTLLQSRETLQQIDVMKRITAKYSNDLYMASSVRDFGRAWKRGKIVGVMGAEGLHQIGNSVAALRQYHALGVRYVTLTHFCNNRYADSCSVEPWHNGLSAEGEKLLLEFNRLGMIIDLSHTSDDTMRSALNVSLAPVIFSHSGAQGVFKHERNAPDDVLYKLRENGGVLNVVFMPEYLGPDYTKVSIDDVVDHVLYIADKIGWEHVGIGSDFDGVEHLPKGLDSVADYPHLIRRIMERSNASDKDIQGFIGGNVLRVWHEVEKRATDLQRRGSEPYEVDEL